MKKKNLTVNSKPMKMDFFGLVIFNHAMVYQQNSWDFVTQRPHGGAGHSPNLETMAGSIALDIIRGAKEGIDYSFDNVPDFYKPERLSGRYYAKLPREMLKKLRELIKEELKKHD